MPTFKDLLAASIKSKDTEERLDMWFNRPVGLVMALAGKKLGVHPNAITAVSVVLGVWAAWMFSHTDLRHNLLGVLLLMLANFCDSADGQLARLTGKKTLVGRVLDGFAGDIWFFSIYFALCCRMTWQPMPGTDTVWGLWIWVLAFIAGVLCHSPQSSLADYYRQIHLLFLNGKAGSELDTYANQRAIFDSLPRAVRSSPRCSTSTMPTIAAARSGARRPSNGCRRQSMRHTAACRACRRRSATSFLTAAAR